MWTRRSFVVAAGAGGILASGLGARMAFANAPSERRFIFIIQRGAADGMGIVAPVGDPAFASQRGALAEDFAGAGRLDSTFALHPSMGSLQTLYAAREALFVHAVASPYRDRSHFDGQNVLETGGSAPYGLQDGWLNRMLGLLSGAEAKAIAVAVTIPLALRGRVEVTSYAPSALPGASDDLIARVAALYANDPQLHALWAQASATRALAGDLAGNDGQTAAATGALAARLLSADGGPRIAMIETGGWDTHAQQRGRLAVQLRGLDAMLGALKAGLGPNWANTVVVVATEFGRTVRINGTEGTDHGTASLVMLVGGAVNGGRVIADWPGLADSALYEGRDLRPTIGLDQVIGRAVAGHYGLEDARVMQTLFPGSASERLGDISRSPLIRR